MQEQGAFEYDFDQDEFDPDGPMYNFFPLESRRFISVKVVQGDVFGEDNEGQMVIIRSDGTVSSFLHGDKDWVHGQLNGEFTLAAAWDTIGFHLGMTDGLNMERTRSGLTTH